MDLNMTSNEPVIVKKSIDVFISYSSKDKNIAFKLCKQIEKNDLKCWIAPRDVGPGHFAESILDGIDRSKSFLLIFSSYSNESEHVLREVNHALSNKLPIIPVRVDNTDPTGSMKYYVSTVHWFDILEISTSNKTKILIEVIKLVIHNNNTPFKELITNVERNQKKSVKIKRIKIISSILLLIAIFSFEHPRNELNNSLEKIYVKFSKEEKKENIFSQTTNLSPYFLMPNPSYKEFSLFMENLEHPRKEYYNDFIKIKNRIEKTNIFITLDSELYLAGSRRLSIDLLSDLKKINNKSPNSIISFYVILLQMYFGNTKIENITNSLQNIKSKGYLIYSDDLENIAIAMQSKDLKKINNNNKLLSPKYYLDLNYQDKITNIDLLREMNYTVSSYLLILKSNLFTEEEKIKSAKFFLNTKNSELNGKIILNSYLNLTSEKSTNEALRLFEIYPTNFKYQVYLLTLFSLNEKITIEKHKEIISRQNNFLKNRDIINLNIETILKKIKTEETDISSLFDLFLKNQHLFGRELKIIRLTKQLLDEGSICSINENLYNLSFFLYLQNIPNLNKVSFSENREIPIAIFDIPLLYKEHGLNYTKCLEENKNLPLDIESFNLDPELTKHFIINGVKNVIDDFNKQKLKAFDEKKIMEAMSTAINCLSDRSQCEKLMDYIPELSGLVEDYFEKFKDDNYPIIISSLIDSIKNIYLVNQEDILLGKINLSTFIDLFIEDLNSNKDIKLDEASCYIIYSYEDYTKYFEDFRKKLFYGIKKSECLPFKKLYNQHRDLILYNIKKTVLANEVKNINIPLDQKKLGKLSSDLDVRLLNLLSPSFYEKHSPDQLTSLINKYHEDLDSSLVSNIILFYLAEISSKIELSISDSKYLVLSEMVRTKQGTYIYEFNNDGLLKKELGPISLANYIPQKILSESDFSPEINIHYGFNHLKIYNKLVKSGISIQFSNLGYIDDTLLIFRLLNLSNFFEREKLNKIEIRNYLTTNYSSYKVLVLLTSFIQKTTGSDDFWAYDEIIKIYEELYVKNEFNLYDRNIFYGNIVYIASMHGHYEKAISLINIKINKMNTKPNYNPGEDYLSLSLLNDIKENKKSSNSYYKKAQSFFMKNIDTKSSDFTPYINLFYLNLFNNEKFDSALENIFLSKFNTNKMALTNYFALKSISDISFGKTIDTDFIKELQPTLNWQKTYIWAKNLSDKSIEKKLMNLLDFFQTQGNH